jgi:cytochrome c oxidase assembly protein subunit 15
MELGEFKVIFMYEYLHRVLGRLIGLIFVLPLLAFALLGRIRPGLMPKLLMLLVLGGCQGLLGWYMVQSGLIDRPSVSQYRLTAHLGLAVALYGAIVWQVLNLWPRDTASGLQNEALQSRGPDVNAHVPQERVSESKSVATYTRTALILVGLVYLMILSGGLVAGTDAGFSYPTWPRMGPSFVPPGLYQGSPAWLAAFEDVTTIQFNHRMFAYALFFLVGGFALSLLVRGPGLPTRERGPRLRLAGLALMAALLLQLSLGIGTVLSHVAVPVAAAHQAGGILLLTVLLFTAHTLQRVRRRSWN